MKYIITVFIILCCIYSSHAQVTFQKRFGHPQSNVAEFIHDAALDEWGNIYIVGSNGFSFEITKVDTFGVTKWMKRLSTQYVEPRKIIAASDSNLVIAGQSGTSTSDNNIFIAKIDTSSNIIWSRYLSTGSIANLTYLLFEDLQGHFITGGYQIVEFDTAQARSKNNPYLAKFDQDGNMLWFKQFPGIYTFLFNDGIVLDNGNYLMIGFAGDTLLGNNDILLLETDTAGAVLRSMVLGNTSDDIGQRIIQHNNKIIIAGKDDNLSPIGTVHFIELDSSWNIIQNRKNYTNGGLTTYNLIPYINNTYLVSANGPMHYLIDSTLKIISGKNYGNSGFSRRLHKSFHIGGGRVFAAGANGDPSDILVLRTDSLLDAGCFSGTTILFNDTIPAILSQSLSLFSVDTSYNIASFDSISSFSWGEILLCNSYTGIDDPDDNIHKEISLFPNPSNGMLNIRINQYSYFNPVHFTIMDMLGRVYASYQIEFSNQNTISLNVQSIPNGSYILKTFIHEKVDFSKFIISR